MEKTYIVNDGGILYEMTAEGYRAFLTAGSKDKDPDPAAYGEYMGAVNFKSSGATLADYEIYLSYLPGPKGAP